MEQDPAFFIARSSRYLEAYSLGRLLLCGDHGLSSALAEQAESFELTFSSKMEFGWPSIISRLSHLKHVRIGDPLRYFQPFVPYANLRHLPPSLTSIHLCYANAHLSLLSKPSTIDILEINDPKPLPLSRMFPSLQSLQVANAYSSVRLEIRISKLLAELSALPLRTLCLRPFTIRYRDFKLLPQSLTHLELLSADFEESSNTYCPPLPPSLEALYITTLPTPAMFNSSIPTTLHTLHIRASWRNFNFSLLPRTLTELTLILDMAPLSEDDFDQFPPDLKVLRMCGFPDPLAVNKFREARPSLYFELNGCRSPGTISGSIDSKEVVLSLQQSQNMEQLKAKLLDGWLGLPKAVKFLFMPSEIVKEADVWSKKLRILFTDRETLAPIKFRNGLEERGLVKYMIIPSVSELQEPNFPSSLTYLSLQGPIGGDPGRMYGSKPFLTAEHILALNVAFPLLRHLQLLDVFDASLLDLLTIPLETFAGGAVENLMDRQLTDYVWSRNLKELSVFSRTFQGRVRTDSEVKNWMEHLPSRIRVLRFVAPLYTGQLGVHLPPSMIAYLPRGLKDFSILVDEMPSPELLSRLPPRLKFFMLRSLNAHNITPEHLLELPTSLQTLHLPYPARIPDQRWMVAFGRSRPELIRMTSDGPPTARSFGLPLVFFSVATEVMQAAKHPSTLGELPTMTPKYRPHHARSSPQISEDSSDEEAEAAPDSAETPSSASEVWSSDDDADSDPDSTCTVQ